MNLQNLLQTQNKIAVAFSGGVDSAYLLYAAKAAGADVVAYYVKTAFQPEFELADARRLATELDIELIIIELDVLADKQVQSNPKNRCYFCKNLIFSNIIKQAKADGYTLIVDGTNASDDATDRPGMRALEELQVRSPLRECGLTKDMIRQLSKEAGLFTWDKPAYACLATRIPCGEEITAEKLRRTELAEEYLSELGFVDFRVRTMGNAAKLQVKEHQMELVLQKRKEIESKLKGYYEFVLLDLEGR